VPKTMCTFRQVKANIPRECSDTLVIGHRQPTKFEGGAQTRLVLVPTCFYHY
jgi:hypothetical protein